MKNNRIAAATVGAALLAGVFAGSVVAAPEPATAQETVDEPASSVVPPGIQTVLDELVADGTLTQAQADAVAEALVAADLRPHRGHHRGAHLGTLTEVLGLDAAELRDALADGATLAELAEQAGVSVDELVASMVAEAEQHLSAAVDQGRLTQEEADERLAEIEERITALVNGEIEFNGPRAGFGPGRDGFGPHVRGFGPGATS